MITKWPGTVYAEAERGRFDSWLLRSTNGEYYTIAYTDKDVVKIDPENFEESDRKAVQEFADQYDFEIDWLEERRS